MPDFNPETIEKGKELLKEEMDKIRDLPMMPLNRSLSRQYPGQDPMGHYSSIDLDFTERMAKVEARMQFMPDSIQNAFTSLSGSKAFEKLSQNMTGASLKFNVAEFMADAAMSRGHSSEVKDYLEAVRDKAAADPKVRNYNDYVTQMEYLTGIRKDPLSQEQEMRLKDNNMLADNFAMSQAGHQRTSKMSELKVNFTNSENWEWQKKIVLAHATGTSGQVREAVDAFTANKSKNMGLEYTEDFLSAYAKQTLTRPLDPFFEDIEANPRLKDEKISRDDLIFINGKSIAQLTQGDSAYGKLPELFRENFRNTLVASALMSGNRVNLYRVEPDGDRIVPEPVPLVAKGHEPTPVNEPHFNAWQSFWAKRGFYKEKVAQLEQFQEVKRQNEMEAKTIQSLDKRLADSVPDLKPKEKEQGMARSR